LAILRRTRASSVWRRAVTVPGILSEDDWRALDPVSRWLILARFPSVTITIVGALMTAALGFRFETLNVGVLVAFFLGVVFAHVTANLINDLIDHGTGLDRGNDYRERFGPHVLERGITNRLRFALLIAAAALPAIACGGFLVWYRGGPTVGLLALGFILVLAYSYPLKRIALGETACLLGYALLLAGGGYWVLTGSWSWAVVVSGLPFALAATGALLGNHLDTVDHDRRNHLATLPIAMGEKRTRGIVVAFAWTQFAVIALLAGVGYFTPVIVLVCGALPYFFRTFLRAFRARKPNERPSRYPEERWPLWYGEIAASFARIFGCWYVVAIVVDTVAHMTGFPWF
jgi:1,4-dihydroxy-2-naphthoate polyprenyltransferase